jgi:serine/threonine protein kinase
MSIVIGRKKSTYVRDPQATGDYFTDSKKTRVSDHYDILQKLGVGSFGFVKKGLHLQTKEMVAIKSCLKANVPRETLISEVELLKTVQGQHSIVNMIDVFESKTKINIVMEYIQGGELFDKIVELEFYMEKDAAKLMKQIADSVLIIHDRNIVHRDLKPENLMFADRECTVLKLIDFGISAMLRSDDELLYDRVGTRTYMAPEIITGGGYGKPADMYSLGVIMYILLVGYPPLDPEEGITELEFPEEDWEEISQDAMDIIVNLLHDDPTMRMDIHEFLAHPWVSGVKASELSLKKKGTINSLLQYNTLTKVNAAVNAGRGNKRMSIYSYLEADEKKNQILGARESMMMSQEDIGARIDQQFKEIASYLDTLTQDLMALSLKGKDSAKKAGIFGIAESVDEVTRNFEAVQGRYNELK